MIDYSDNSGRSREDVNGFKSTRFEIFGEDVKKLNAFRKKHGKCFEKYPDCTGSLFVYSFIPTTIGIAITVKCSCGEELCMGDFLDSWLD